MTIGRAFRAYRARQLPENTMPDYLSIARRALELPKEPRTPDPLECVLQGRAIELWSDAAGCLFIVADEDDARRLGEPRGIVYTATEMRLELQIGDPAIVLEIHEWKRAFNGRLREVQRRGQGMRPGAAATGAGVGDVRE